MARNHRAEYSWRLDRNPDYFKESRQRRGLDRKYVGGYVGEKLADALREAAKQRGTSQTDLIAMALRKELSDDLG